MNKFPQKNKPDALPIGSNGLVHAVTGSSSTSAVPAGARYVRCTQTVAGGTEDIFFNFGATATIGGADTTVLSQAAPQKTFHVPSGATTLAAIGTGNISMFLEYFS